MLLHIRPRAYCLSLCEIKLVDVAFEPYGVVLRGDIELAARNSYRDSWLVACRREGTKGRAADGIFVEAPRPPRGEFRVTTRWAVDAERVVVHRVRYRLLDEEFDAASDAMYLWLGCAPEWGGWSNRRPSWAKNLLPIREEPRLQIVKSLIEWEVFDKKQSAVNVFDDWGGILERKESFAMPTIERGRLVNLTEWIERLPRREDVFQF